MKFAAIALALIVSLGAYEAHANGPAIDATNEQETDNPRQQNRRIEITIQN